METAKTKLKECVDIYRKTFPQEFAAFKEWSDKVRSAQRVSGNKFAELKGSDMVQRKLGEIPERLHTLIEKMLSAEELQWYQADGAYKGDYRGPTWFYTTFPVFRVTEEM